MNDTSRGGRELTVTALVVTYNRPDHVRQCLTHLRHQTQAPDQVVVVDASPEETTYEIIAREFPEVEYLRNPFGAGSTATSRAIGLTAAHGDILAMVDDDAYAAEDWLANLLLPYADPQVGGVGGRALNGIAGEESEGRGQIGMLLPNGTLTGHFAADPGRDIEVDHLLGANMSFRRQVLEDIGGIADHYPGTCLREETDIALRVTAAGHRLVYTPRAVVRHVAGPYAKGKRFDRRYLYFGHRNHVVLLSRTRGPRSAMLREYLQLSAREAARELVGPAREAARRRSPVALLRAGVGGGSRALTVLGGTGAGLVAARRAQRTEP
ncbi:glycosyltransferase family 2 protein [Luteipulveratus flavus]|uniref:Glycosyltransferase family 2 protein n=1 Tax=Luteipulveratus flavus TaxID=3031728 RepID=A0ABT6CEN2_9MICO|nr:glycosyltransferase family 2 protein [Luteipulveratus sp. YIM 133296]MDF8266499.1 glycosyltransferase family 2 protein [Luteipulveratus sp. YIM 133296]